MIGEVGRSTTNLTTFWETVPKSLTKAYYYFSFHRYVFYDCISSQVNKNG